MEEALVSTYLLAVMFLLVALAYASVGLGGGSSYTALMTIFGVGYVAIPTITLLLNLVVTTVGTVSFVRGRHLRIRLVLPFLVTSIPMAYLGGSLSVPRGVFYWVLLASLVFVALRIYLWKDPRLDVRLGRAGRIGVSLLSGSLLGLVAGIVGIGGGIYLIPLIILLRLGTEKEAAACGSIFIWMNSLSGLIARLLNHPIEVAQLVPLAAAVLVGGAVGAHLGSARLSPRTMQKVLGGIVLVAILLLARRVLA